jgi:hypothetical protein
VAPALDTPVAGRHGFALAAGGLLALDVLVRLAVGVAYPGASVLLLLACALSLVPLLPAATSATSLRLALAPALAVGAFAVLLTTVSVAGIRLTEVSIRLAVAALVLVLAVLAAAPRAHAADGATRRRSARGEWATIAALVAIAAFSLASSWDIVYPLQASGTDWGHYLLYADEVEAQERLLIDDPLAGDEGRVFADPPAIGALYGSFRILDGVSSWSLGFGIVVASALSVLSVYGAAGSLWGAWAGLAGAAAYAVAPIRLDPMYWHGLGTTLALVFVPLVVLGLGLVYRGDRDRRTVLLLGLSLAAVGAAHATSAIAVAAFFLVALVLAPLRGRAASAALAGAGGLACVLGAGVIAHLALQARDLGRPVSYRFLDPHWANPDAVAGYFSWEYLALTGVALVVVLTSRRLRGDPALLAVGALALGGVLVSQLWRVHVPFEYRRSVYYLGVATALVIGVAFVRFRPGAASIAGLVVVLAYVAHLSVGLRLPERVLSGPEPRSPGVTGLTAFRERLDRGALPDSPRVVTDACVHFSVPYLVRRPTLPAFGERQVGFVGRLPLARKAAAILEGGREGRRVAESLGVRYAIADPRCESDLAGRIGGSVVLENDEIVVVRLPGSA